MSAQSWLDAYYPKPANETTPEEAVAHSLRKWEGLRPEVLAQHEVEMDADGFELVDSAYHAVLEITSNSCALCHHRLKTRVTPAAHGQEGPAFCETCPLSIVRGGVACDEERDDEASSPWAYWTDSADPEPMIRWLREAKEYEAFNALQAGTSHAREQWDPLIYGGTPPSHAREDVSLSASQHPKPPLQGLTCESAARPSITSPDEE